MEVTPLSPALGTASCVLPTPTSMEDRRLRRASTSLSSFSFSLSRATSRSSSSRTCRAGHRNRVPLAPGRVLVAFPAPGHLQALFWPHLLLHGAQGGLIQLRTLAGSRERTGRDECCPHVPCPLCSPGTRWCLPRYLPSLLLLLLQAPDLLQELGPLLPQPHDLLVGVPVLLQGIVEITESSSRHRKSPKIPQCARGGFWAQTPMRGPLIEECFGLPGQVRSWGPLSHLAGGAQGRQRSLPLPRGAALLPD